MVVIYRLYGGYIGITWGLLGFTWGYMVINGDYMGITWCHLGVSCGLYGVYMWVIYGLYVFLWGLHWGYKVSIDRYMYKKYIQVGGDNKDYFKGWRCIPIGGVMFW